MAWFPPACCLALTLLTQEARKLLNSTPFPGPILITRTTLPSMLRPMSLTTPPVLPGPKLLVLNVVPTSVRIRVNRLHPTLTSDTRVDEAHRRSWHPLYLSRPTAKFAMIPTPVPLACIWVQTELQLLPLVPDDPTKTKLTCDTLRPSRRKGIKHTLKHSTKQH